MLRAVATDLGAVGVRYNMMGFFRALKLSLQRHSNLDSLLEHEIRNYKLPRGGRPSGKFHGKILKVKERMPFTRS